MYTVDSQSEQALGECLALSFACDQNAHSMPLCGRPKVLFFGAVQGSFNDKRAKMCDVSSLGCIVSVIIVLINAYCLSVCLYVCLRLFAL